jgi:hypothetical protein
MQAIRTGRVRAIHVIAHNQRRMDDMRGTCEASASTIGRVVRSARTGHRLSPCVDWKEPERNQVVVQVLACGVCHRYWSPRLLLLFPAECLLVCTATPSSRPAFGAFRTHGFPGTRYFGVTVAWGLF